MTMGGIKLKVCGLKYPANVLEIGSLTPDYLGFNFYKPSPRYVGDDFWIPLVLSPKIKRVGVFVNEIENKVFETVQKYALDFVQLHGGESERYCEKLKNRGIAIIKVFSIDDSFDFSTTKKFADVSDYFLFDTKGKFYGGNAKTFDWELLKKYDQSIPFFLAGGISPDVIQEIKNLDGMRLHAIDVNSAVESSHGVKDVNLVNELIDELKKSSL